jgi:hypothetical protein
VTSRRFVLLFTVGVLATTAASARAGFTPAWSYLSPSLRAQLAGQMGGSLFLPARTPLFYRYRSGAVVSNGTLTVPFTNRVRIRKGLWRWTKDTFTWRVAPLRGACTAWGTVDKTLQLGGNKVYWSSEGTAWRCVQDRRGKQYVLSASEATNLGDAGLGTVVASGLDVSGRTSSLNVAIVVTPSTVRPGGKVVVSGVAGGCPAGDSVTLLSHAFSPAHEFAGVPAVYAQVGSAGRFSTTTTIPGTVAAGRYGVTARCGGGNLGVSATITVTH